VARIIGRPYASARRISFHDAAHHQRACVSGSDIVAAWLTVLLAGAAMSSMVFG
jgi:hypothetical protein